jgi:hypothetical protein
MGNDKMVLAYQMQQYWQGRIFFHYTVPYRLETNLQETGTRTSTRVDLFKMSSKTREVI